MPVSKHVTSLARQFFQMSLTNGQISPEKVSGVLGYLEKHPPRRALAVLRAYQRLVMTDLAKGHAVVEQASAMPGDTLDLIAKALSKKYGRTVTATAKSNPDLIAGMRVRVGDDVYEASVAGQLEALAASV